MSSSTPFFELRHGDCLDGMARLKPESVDAIVTSPPYNVGIGYSTFDDTARRDDFLGWLTCWAEAVCRVLKPDGSLFLNIGATPANPLLPHQIALRFSERLVLQNTFHWIKSITLETKEGEQISAGHFKPINSPRFVTDCHEYIFHFTKTGKVPVDRLAVGVPYADKSNITRWKKTAGRDQRCRGNNWFIPYPTIHFRDKQRPHPATFPVELVAMCLKLHRVDSQSVVLDPFVGIGHAAIAAAQCGAGKFIGFDLDRDYLGEAKRKLEEYGGSKLRILKIPAKRSARPGSR